MSPASSLKSSSTATEDNTDTGNKASISDVSVANSNTARTVDTASAQEGKKGEQSPPSPHLGRKSRCGGDLSSHPLVTDI
jgi:hypothetical protein